MPAESDLAWVASVDDAQSEKVVLVANVAPADANETTSTLDDVEVCDCDDC